MNKSKRTLRLIIIGLIISIVCLLVILSGVSTILSFGLYAILFFNLVNTIYGVAKIHSKSDNVRIEKKDDEDTWGLNEFITKFRVMRNISNLPSDMNLKRQELISQLERFKSSKESVFKMLTDEFDASEMTYARFEGVLNSCETIAVSGARKVYKFLTNFNYNEYKAMESSTSISVEIRAEKKKVYSEILDYIKDVCEKNETLLLNLDKMSLELAKLDMSDINDAELAELNQLIDTIKLYK